MYIEFDITALTGSDVTALIAEVVSTPAETSFRGDARRYDLTANVMELNRSTRGEWRTTRGEWSMRGE